MKDAQYRETFEKVFPDLKKQKEDKEKLQRYDMILLVFISIACNLVDCGIVSVLEDLLRIRLSILATSIKNTDLIC